MIYIIFHSKIQQSQTEGDGNENEHNDQQQEQQQQQQQTQEINNNQQPKYDEATQALIEGNQIMNKIIRFIRLFHFISFYLRYLNFNLIE